MFKDEHRFPTSWPCEQVWITSYTAEDEGLLDNQKLGVYVALEAKGDSCASGPGV